MAQRWRIHLLMQETRVRFLGWEYPLKKKMATDSSILAWKIPWTEEPGRLQPMGSQRVRHNWATSLSFFMPRSVVAGSCGSCILVFWGTSILFAIVAVPIYIPTNSVRGFPFFQYFLFLDILLIDFLTSAKWYLIMVLICIYLIINNSNVEHLFMCLLDICMSSLKKSLFSKGLLLPIFWLNFFYIELYKLLVYFGK